jgi:hypothetical protein
MEAGLFMFQWIETSPGDGLVDRVPRFLIDVTAATYFCFRFRPPYSGKPSQLCLVPS